MQFARPQAFRIQALAIFVLAVLAAGQVSAQAAPPTKGEQAVKYRKALYQVIVWDVGPMGAMAQDKIPFVAADFARRAQNVAVLTPRLADAYPPESQGVVDSKLNPDMWANRADFDLKMQALVDASATLAAVAKAGDEAKTKAAFFDMANACKNCHEKFRNK